MGPGLRIAWRYLFSRKSRGVINVISGISTAGMAVGTAALVLILSVYNGFDALIRTNLDSFDPDLRIEAASGKCFVPEGTAFDTLRTRFQVSETVEDNVFLSYGSRQGVARAIGREGSQCSVGAGLARSMGINPHLVSPLHLYYPDRTAAVSLASPQNSLNSAVLHPDGIFSISSELDDGCIFVPLDVMRGLLGYGSEVSALEVRFGPGGDEISAKAVRQLLGPDYRVLDRVQQHPSLYKMMRSEKAAIFAILAFVVLIVAFNVYGSLSMLIVEKRQDIETLRSMGATEGLVRRIFVLEGWLVSLLGLAVGLAVGVLAAVLQQRFGLVKMPGNLLVQAYPVVLKAGDVLLTAVTVSLLGLLVSLPAVRSNIRRN